MKALRHAARAAVFHAAIWQSERSTALLKWTMSRLGLPITDPTSPRSAGSAPVDREPAPTPAPPHNRTTVFQPHLLEFVPIQPPPLEFIEKRPLLSELGKRFDTAVFVGVRYATRPGEPAGITLFHSGIPPERVSDFLRTSAESWADHKGHES